ncbi:hypothetical protein LEP1GSC040_0993 [Leptospira santarosai str. 2000030832]|nr:hypothetical protein LEP1GSC040_0993 [Leptospira santarosai str. 2000030832]
MNSLIELKLTTFHYTEINHMIDHRTPFSKKDISYNKMKEIRRHQIHFW